MTIDITKFNQINIIDSCAIWNVLSSNTLFIACINAKCSFAMTKFVEYECLHKPRKEFKEADQRIVKILQKEKKHFPSNNLSIDDLQEITTYGENIKLGIGELSSIAFAKKTNLSFMSDDQKARKLASKILGKDKVQTTPHLVGWLIFNNDLNDTDISLVISEHNASERPLEKYFQEVYLEALRIKCITR